MRTRTARRSRPRVEVDVLAAGPRRQARHRPHLARERRDESRPGGQPDLADRQAEAGRAALERGVVAERVLALGHADREPAEAERLVLRELLRGGRGSGPRHPRRRPGSRSSRSSRSARRRPGRGAGSPARPPRRRPRRPRRGPSAPSPPFAQWLATTAVARAGGKRRPRAPPRPRPACPSGTR